MNLFTTPSLSPVIACWWFLQTSLRSSISDVMLTFTTSARVKIFGTPVLSNISWRLNVSTVDIGVLLVQGHLEFFICNADDLDDPEESVVTQECFNKYPLTRASDDHDNSPVDPNFSGRYYVDPECRASEVDQSRLKDADGGQVMHMRYRLPDDLTCTHCTLQMIYCEFVSAAHHACASPHGFSFQLCTANHSLAFTCAISLAHSLNSM